MLWERRKREQVIKLGVLGGGSTADCTIEQSGQGRLCRKVSELRM